MLHRGRTRKLTALLILFSCAAHVFAAQEKKDQDKKKELPQGTPILRRVPADVSALDLGRINQLAAVK